MVNGSKLLLYMHLVCIQVTKKCLRGITKYSVRSTASGVNFGKSLKIPGITHIGYFFSQSFLDFYIQDLNLILKITQHILDMNL